MATSLEKAREVKNTLSEQFFNAASKLPVSSIGIGSVDNGNYYVSVGLERAPTKKESSRLPGYDGADYDGVSVKYDVIGKIKPL